MEVGLIELNVQFLDGGLVSDLYLSKFPVILLQLLDMLLALIQLHLVSPLHLLEFEFSLTFHSLIWIQKLPFVLTDFLICVEKLRFIVQVLLLFFLQFFQLSLLRLCLCLVDACLAGLDREFLLKTGFFFEASAVFEFDLFEVLSEL